MTDDVRYLMDPDLAPEHDALDRQVWNEIIQAMGLRDAELNKLAQTHNSISFRRECLMFERAMRVVRVEAAKAAEWKRP